MKTVAVLLVATLATALKVAPPAPHVNKRTTLLGRQANVSAAVVTPADEAAQEGVVQVDGQLVDAADLNVDDAAAAAAAGNNVLDLTDAADILNIDGAGVGAGNVNLDNVNLDNINLDGFNVDDLANNFAGGNDVVADILNNINSVGANGDFSSLAGIDFLGGINSLIAGMGLSSFVDVGLFANFGFAQQLELFLLLQQLNQLMIFGFINQFNVLALIQQGLILNQFNFGFFKRSVHEWRDNYHRKQKREERLRRRDLRRRQLQVSCGAGAAAAAAPAAAVIPAAAAAPVAAAPVAAAPVSALNFAPEDVAFADESQVERLSDFTK